ncbi:MAG: SAM-dependent methyltransferase [Candidatus Cloacimonetes bacterium]|nr:SAM-dependent methyltransferase [Candidatus Cloacimonadota bacterium]
MKYKKSKKRIEFGDFQTPYVLALKICERLKEEGISPATIIEPSCGLGAFIKAAVKTFPSVNQIYGFDINEEYLDILRTDVSVFKSKPSVYIEKTDFFSHDWKKQISLASEPLLILGNFPWVTNTTQSVIGGINLPHKSNFHNTNGFDSINGNANFDISEWMFIEVFRWLAHRNGDIAMLLKKSVARKVVLYAERNNLNMQNAFLIDIDAKKHFGAFVDACLIVIQIRHESKNSDYDYIEYRNFDDKIGQMTGHRRGMAVKNMSLFDNYSHFLGESPIRWRSGVKHDMAQIMELKNVNNVLSNGLDETLNIESKYLYPLLKGSDIGSGNQWRNTYLLVTQRHTGEDTSHISVDAPLTWSYLVKHKERFASRRSTIYKRAYQFSIFGIGDYAFLPWKIAICGFYKSIQFRLIGPIEDKPVMFDDTVYYISFHTEREALEALQKISSNEYLALLSSMMFVDEKRPIKAGVLNKIDWSQI